MEHDMNRAFAVAALALSLTACKKNEPAVQQSAAPPMPANELTVNDSFRTPESVLYDAAGDRYIVSNINGGPVDKDNNGFISIVSPSGHVDSLAWIQGGRGGVTLNGPKGMGLRGDTLFVADVDELRLFNRTTGAFISSTKIPGATFLNDVSVGADGAVWFTDTGVKGDFSPAHADAIYHRDPRTGQVHKIAHGDDLGHPNGILADSTGAVVVTFGSGEVYHIDMQGHRTAMAKPPHGQLDGVIRTGNGHYIVSSWADSSVIGMAPGDSMYMSLVHPVPSPADIGFDSKRDRILIPVFSGNRIEIRPASAPASPHAQ
jgi:sugar lactone lactonase YvrE